ncbi:MAG TPA: hypothetical protein DCL41_00910 [Bdellovibrionales bacterium]|nr:hypothetical protein [Pseudobdellovibrionaceae bacterium]HAG90397.1 hypothetical protein [Bdellovibrionales bacterium]|tara:strand:- start:280 stop:1773 length:1494 start_codon:yes stop_codon:yes gene_type:complete
MLFKSQKFPLETLMSLVSTPLLVFEVPSLKLLASNDAASELSGYSPSDFGKLSVNKIFDESSQTQIEAIAEIVSSGPTKIFERESSIRRKSGRKCPVSVHAQSLAIDGKSYLFLNLIDLSEERKQQEERNKLLLESARISKLADLGRLTAGMAHELNNPLAIMAGFLEEMRFQVEDNRFTQESLLSNLDPIDRACNRMAKIVSGMLSKVRNEPQKRSEMPLRKIVEDVTLFFERVFKAHGIKPSIELIDGVVNCNPSQVDQILTNIISNACNALEDVKNPELKVKISKKGPNIELSVWNNGPAIPMDVQEKLFTPFFTTKAVGEGTGLGLYMSYQFMKAHGGDLSFKSEDGYGTAFNLKFPLVKSSRIAKSQEGAPTALVLDDEGLFRKLLDKKLKRFGVASTQARDLKSAVFELENHPFDFVFVDYNLSHQKGTELISMLTGAKPTPKLILVSGQMENSELKKLALDNGFDGHLTKPFTTEDLSQILNISQVKKAS